MDLLEECSTCLWPISGAILRKSRSCLARKKHHKIYMQRPGGGGGGGGGGASVFITKLCSFAKLCTVSPI